MKRQFKNLNEALDTLKNSNQPEFRAIAYIFEDSILFDLDLEALDNDQLEQESKPKSFWRAIGELFGF